MVIKFNFIVLFLLITAESAFSVTSVNPSFEMIDAHIEREKVDLIKDQNEVKDELSEAALSKEQIQRNEEGAFHFSQGVLFFKDHDYEKAIEEFDKVKEIEGLQNHLHFYKGLSHFKAGDYKEAVQAFSKQRKVKGLLRQDSKYYHGKALLKLKKGSQAYNKLRSLPRRFKRKEKRPEVLNLLLEAGVKDKLYSKGSYCSWVRKLYTKYPTSTHSIAWNFTPEESLSVEGQKVSCSISYKDKKKRLKRFFRMGLKERLYKDLMVLEEGKEKIDLLVEYHYLAGEMHEALNLAKNNEITKKEKDEALSRISRIQYYSGKYEDSLETLKTQIDSQKSKNKKAGHLFNYASRQLNLKNHEEAEKVFSKILKNHAGSSYYFRAKWGVPWSQYLSGKFSDAVKGFESLKKDYKRRPRRFRRLKSEQIQYWLSRAYEKSESMSEAVKGYQALTTDPMLSYYGLLASLRLSKISKEKMNFISFIEVPWKKINDSESLEKKSFLSKFNEAPAFRQIASVEEESDLVKEVPVEDEVEQVALHEPSKASLTEEEKSKSLSNYVKLSRLGLYDYASEELSRAMSKAKEPEVKDHVLTHFEKMNEFEKLSKLTLRHFRKERLSSNVYEAKKFWQKGYPEAYKGHVKAYSSKFKVPSHLVWSIMRAESFFNKKAQSEVGAKGLLQLMPETAYKVQSLLGEEDKKTKEEVSGKLFTPKLNIKLGSSYLSRLNGVFSRKIPLVAAAYNAGPHRVKMWSQQFGDVDLDEFIERVPFKETKNYIKKVLRHSFIYQTLYGDVSVKKVDFNYLIEPTDYVYKGSFPMSENWESI